MTYTSTQNIKSNRNTATNENTNTIPQTLRAEVLKGCGFGRHFGVPGANMDLNLDWGIYTGTCQHGPIIIYSHGKEQLKSRGLEKKLKLDSFMPCLRNKGLAEGFILNFSGDLYGQTLEINNLTRVPEQYLDFISAFVCNYDHRRYCNERWVDMWPGLGTTKGLNIYFSPFTFKLTVGALALMGALSIYSIYNVCK